MRFRRFGFRPTDLLQALFAVAVVLLFEAIEAVAAVPHDLARLRDVAELSGEFQHADFRLDDLLFSRHRTSDDRQLMS